VFLTNIEDSHTNRQCFYLRLPTLVASDGIWAESKRADVESLIRVTNSDLLVVDQNSWNNTPLWLVDYNEFYEGRTINAFDKHNNHSLYYTLCSTLMNAFSSNTYAFIILEGLILNGFNKRLCLSVWFSFTKCLWYTGTCLIQAITIISFHFISLTLFTEGNTWQ
jgi:hypothetical protein